MDSSTQEYPDRKLIESNISLMETPVGDRDGQPKIQLCLELREMMGKKKSNRKTLQLDVVVMKVKNLNMASPSDSESGESNKKKPKSNGKRAQPSSKPASVFVRVTFEEGLKENQLEITELKDQDTENNNAFFFGEPFTFPIKNKNITSSTLHVEVCDKKVTRQALCFGQVEIHLEDIKLGQPLVKWYILS